MDLHDIELHSMWMCLGCPAIFRSELHLLEHGQYCHQYACIYCNGMPLGSKDAFVDHFYRVDHFEALFGVRRNPLQIDKSTQCDIIERAPILTNISPTSSSGHGTRYRIKAEQTDFDEGAYMGDLSDKVNVILDETASEGAENKSSKAKKGNSVKIIFEEGKGISKEITKKLKSKKKTKKAKCSYCSKWVAGYRMDSHIRVQHKNESAKRSGERKKGKLECCTCHMFFDSPKLMAKHIKDEHYIADDDDEIDFSSPVGKSDESSQVICKYCGDKCKHAHHLRYHILSVHSKPVPCQICEMVCKNIVMMNKHLVRVHDDVVKCSLCGTGLTAPFFKDHMLRVHDIEADLLVELDSSMCEEFCEDDKMEKCRTKKKRKKRPDIEETSIIFKKRCCIPNCLGTTKRSFYWLTDDDDVIKQTWLESIQSAFPEFVPRPKAKQVICHFHFNDTDFELDINGFITRSLIAEAVPTVFEDLRTADHKSKRKREAGSRESKFMHWKRKVTPEEMVGKTADQIRFIERTCHLCGEFFKRGKEYQMHMQLFHVADPLPIFRPFKPSDNVICEVCGGTVTKGNYAGHLSKHANVRKFSCSDCDKKFFSQSSLNAHFKSYHGERIICPVCGAEFRSNPAFRYHMNNTHGNVSELNRRITCNACGKELKNMKIFRQHYNKIHLNERNRKPCSICNKIFAAKMALEDHMNAVHLKEHSYRCVTCNSCYTQKKQCWRHYRQAHQLRVNYSNWHKFVQVIPWIDGMGRHK